MFLIRSTSLGVVVFLVFFTGCSSKKEDETRGKAPPEVQAHAEITGPLINIVRKHQSEKNLSHCDLKNTQIKEELALALDARADEIAKYIDANGRSSDLKTVQLGKAQIQVPLKEPLPGAGEWKNYPPEGWEISYKIYQKIKNQPINRAWINLNSAVRSVLVNDEERIWYDENLTLDHASEPLIHEAYGAIKKCWDDPNCDTPEFSPQIQDYLNNNAYFKSHRGKFKDLYFALIASEKRFQFFKNPGVRRIDESTLELPMDPGPFDALFEEKDGKTEIANEIVKTWSSDSLKLKIRWTTQQVEPLAYLFVFLENAPGKRPATNFDRKAVTFNNSTRVKSLSHEIGHVLGFADHYYTIWHEETCDYTQETNLGDVMSESSTGQVTAEEWSKLNAIYPFFVDPATLESPAAI